MTAGDEENSPRILLQSAANQGGSSTANQYAIPVPASGGTSLRAVPCPLLSESTDGPGRPVNGIGDTACIAMKLLQDVAAGQRMRALMSLSESIPHSMKLQQLQKVERQIQKEGSSHKRNGRRLSKELYIILSWYALVVSALFAAVAETTLITCDLLWGPVVIMELMAAATTCGVWHKLRSIWQIKQDQRISRVRQNAVYDKIAELSLRGAACNLDCLQPSHDHESPGLARSGSFCGLQHHLSFFSPHAVLVLFFLIGISALAIVSFNSILCAPRCHCSHP